MRYDTRSFVFLLAGVAVGILIASEKGTHIRRKITDRFEDYKDSFKETDSGILLSKADVESSIEEDLSH